MNQLKKLEKSKGIVIFANNTESIKYVKLAEKAAYLAEKNLSLPVTILTNTLDNNLTNKNKRFSVDTGAMESWNNLNRYMAFELSPYDQTILIDSDYLIFDNNLLKLLDTVNDYCLHSNNIFVDNLKHKEILGKYSLKSLWATVIIFNKTKKSELLFKLVKRIQNNFPYYCKLYNIQHTNFRNDYAFTIADNIINGYKQDNSNYIPYPLISVGEPLLDFQIKNESFFIKTKSKAFVLPKQNIHILSKKYLEENFNERS